MTLDQLITAVTSALTRVGSNRVSGPDILTSVLNVISYFATQISSIIPLWTDSLTFQQDGSDDGRFCRYADTNGKIRLFETKVDDNTNNAPPTNPVTTENAFWREVSASASAAIPEWAAGIYGPGLIIVYHNHSVDGKGLYVLVDPARPYISANIETEITAGDWERIGSPVAAGQTREFNREWDSDLLFDKNEIHYAQHELTEDTEFTIAISGHLENQFCSIVQEIVTDGTHSVSFSGFKYVLGDVQNGSIPEAGTHIVFFLYFNGVATVNWSKPTSEVANLTPLSTPENFEAVMDGETEIDLTWDNVSNNQGYRIDVSLDGVSGWSELTTTAADAVSYSHAGLSAGSQRFYRITALGDLVTFANSPYATDQATTENAGDVTAPTFTFEPADSEADIPVNKPIVITCSEPIRDADGVTAITNSNVADYITLKEDNISGADIPFTATIDAGKTVITITPNVVYPSLGDVFVQIDGVEDVNGNESTADDATFTTNDFTIMQGNYLDMGTQIDSVVEGADKNFELEVEYQEFLVVSGKRGFFQKDTAGGRSLIAFTDGDDVYFTFYDSTTRRRQIIWPNAFSGFTAGKITFKYFGAVDTNDGLDRVDFYIDDVLITAGKSMDVSGGSWPFDIGANSTKFVLSGPVFREVKNFIVRNNMGATTVVNIPVIRTGIDISGNALHGTWTGA